MPLSRRDLMKLGAVVTARLLVEPSRTAEVRQAGADSPNVVFVLADDQGYGQLGCYSDTYTPEMLASKGTCTGSQLEAFCAAARRATPHVDRLAREGMRLLDVHSAPTCAPSRACLLTGCYPHRFGVYANADIMLTGVPKQAFFLPELLRRAGYRTGIVGKWHLGSGEGQHPLDRGFDMFFGFDAAATDKWASGELYRDRERAAPVGFLTEQITKEAARFMRDSVARGNPFFLYVAYNAPHGPRPAPPPLYRLPFEDLRRQPRYLYAYVRALDEGVGRLLDMLEELGISENTLVVYASDNGVWVGGCPPGNGRYRGGKRTLWEGGHRVPMVIRWPGHVPAGRDGHALTHFMDVLPTVLAAAGVRLRHDVALDGVNMLPVWLGRTAALPGSRTLFWACPHRRSDAHWILEWQKWQQTDGRNRSPFAFLPAGWMVRQGAWKLINPGTQQVELYNLELDPGEKVDRAVGNPEMVRQLGEAYRAWIRQMPRPLRWGERKWRDLLACP